MPERTPGQHPDESHEPESATPEERFARMSENADLFSRNALDLAWTLGTQGFPGLPDDFIAYYQAYENGINTAFALGREASATTEQKSPPEKQLLLLQSMHPDMHYPLVDAFFMARGSRQTDLEATFQEKDIFDESQLRFSPEQQRVLIEAYNIGAEMAGHPPFVPPATGETARETQHNSTSEASTSAEQKKERISLDEVKTIIRNLVSENAKNVTVKTLELDLLTAGPENSAITARIECHKKWVGDLSINATFQNIANGEIGVFSAFVDANRFVKPVVEEQLGHFYEKLKEYAEEKYDRSIASIQIVGSDLEITFAESPAASAAEPDAAQPTDAEQAIAPESEWVEMKEFIDPELAELQRNLAATREKYARLAVIAEKQNKKRPRERAETTEIDEGQARMRINLLREDLAIEDRIRPVEGIADAEKTYRDALNALREYQGQQIENGPDLNPEQRRKELQAIILETSAHEASRLYDLKTQIKAEEWTKGRMERFDKAVSANAFYKIPLDVARANREVAKEIGHAAMRVVELYRKLNWKTKVAVSAGLFGSGVASAALGVPILIAATGGAVALQRLLGGGSAAIATEAFAQRHYEKKTRKEVNEEMFEAEQLAGQISGLLALDDQRLNNLMLEQAGRKGWERNKRIAVAGIVFAAIASGAPGKLLRVGITHAAETGAGKAVVESMDDWKTRVGGFLKRSLGLEDAQPETLPVRPTPVPAETGAQTAPETRETIQQQIDDLREQHGRSYDQSGQTSDPTARAQARTERMKLREEIRTLQDKLEQAKPPAAAETALKKIAPVPLDDKVGWRQNLQRFNISEAAVKERVKLENPLITGGQAEKYAEATWTSEANRVLQNPKLAQELAARTVQLNAASMHPPAASITPPEKGVLSQAPPAPRTAEPGPKAAPPAEPKPPAPPAVPEPQPKPPVPPAETVSKTAPVTVEKPFGTAAPKNAAEVVARARAQQIIELATVRKGEGAWQAVRRQLYARIYDDIQKNPKTNYDITPQEAAKLPHDFEHPPKIGKIAKILDRETLAALKQAGYINPDGTTHVGMRPGAHVMLTPDNKIDISDEGKSIYEFDKSKAGGAGHPVDETPRARGRAGASRSLHDYAETTRGPDAGHLMTAPDAADSLTSDEYAASPAGQAAMEQAQAAQLKTNLVESGVTPKEFKNIERMRTDTFVKSIERNAPQIREWRNAGSRANTSVRITEGSFTTRGVNVSGKEAGKYLDLVEQLEKHFKAAGYTEHQRLLRRPVGEVLRAIKLKK